MSSLFQRDGDAYDLKDRLTGCVAYNANAKTPGYGYDPHAAPGVIFTLVFGISALAHIVQSFRGRKLGYLTFAVGALGTYCFRNSIACSFHTDDLPARRMLGLACSSSCASLSIQQTSILDSNIYSDPG